ncbi:MAG: nucleotidyltransferase domain-containing protein, partial [Lysobacter sp.]|nr:nucleotidyltransferase domain-containing protein [Lysobacter sp.]
MSGAGVDETPEPEPAAGVGDSTSHPADDAAWAAAARAAVAQLDGTLAVSFKADCDIDRLLKARTAGVDGQVIAAWHRCVGAGEGLGLFAVGGYGRGELFPQSDIDLLVLAEPQAQLAHADALARFVALLWDAGLQA